MAFAADAYWVGHQIHTSTMGITVVSKGSLQKWFRLQHIVVIPKESA
jgi:hypothetical protein